MLNASRTSERSTSFQRVSEGLSTRRSCAARTVRSKPSSIAVVSTGQQSAPRFSSCQVFDNQGVGVEFSDQARGELLDCEIFSNKSANVLVEGKSQPALFRCVIHDGNEEGLVVMDKSDGRFEACEFYANARSGILLSEFRAMNVIELADLVSIILCGADAVALSEKLDDDERQMLQSMQKAARRLAEIIQGLQPQ